MKLEQATTNKTLTKLDRTRFLDLLVQYLCGLYVPVLTTVMKVSTTTKNERYGTYVIVLYQHHFKT